MATHGENIVRQFGEQAENYQNSTVHASGADLEALSAWASGKKGYRVLDLGAGAGHASFTLSPHVHSVVSADLTEKMLSMLEKAAGERSLGNISVRKASADRLPFPDHSFCAVVSRYSAHHWENVSDAVREICRVLKPGGEFVLLDIIAPEEPLFDTFLQVIEFIRDGSHVRDHRSSEWIRLIEGQGFSLSMKRLFPVSLDFSSWVRQSGTSPERVEMLRGLFDNASAEVRKEFAIDDGGSFQIKEIMIVATKPKE